VARERGEQAVEVEFVQGFERDAVDIQVEEPG
jgi:hypothetical protein